MNGNAFECYDEQTYRRQYIKTVQALESHAKKMFKCSKDLAPLFATQPRLPLLVAPPKPAKTSEGKEPDEGDVELWREEIKELAKRKRILHSNLSAIQEAIIWGQCSEAMKAHVKSLNTRPGPPKTTACSSLTTYRPSPCSLTNATTATLRC